MSHYKNKLAELKEKVRLVEKSGQKNTVHHENLENYLKAQRSAKKEDKGVTNNDKQNG